MLGRAVLHDCGISWVSSFFCALTKCLYQDKFIVCQIKKCLNVNWLWPTNLSGRQFAQFYFNFLCNVNVLFTISKEIRRVILARQMTWKVVKTHLFFLSLFLCSETYLLFLNPYHALCQILLTGFNISYKLSPMQTICMKYQTCLQGK